jgi:hypothetical protein
MFLASTLDSLPEVRGLHEGHELGDPPTAVLPLVNLQNRQAWHEPNVAELTVSRRRDPQSLIDAAQGADLLVDVAFYNAPLLPALRAAYPVAPLIAVFRRCEPFVRSATILHGEDHQPAGWPDPAKPLTDRERFIELGRLKPRPGTAEADAWPTWSAIQRNIWLWHTVNSHLLALVRSRSAVAKLLVEDLAADPEGFWSACLDHLGLGDEHVPTCLARSTRRLNARSTYQIGPISSWSDAEHDLYRSLAEPLEGELYE